MVSISKNWMTDLCSNSQDDYKPLIDIKKRSIGLSVTTADLEDLGSYTLEGIHIPYYS